MKHTYTLLIPLCAALLGTAPVASAKELSDTTQEKEMAIVFVKTPKAKEIADILARDRAKGPGETPVPHFAIHTRDNKFVLTIGGKINPIIGADFGNDLYTVLDKNNGFITDAIPVPSQSGRRSNFYINALNTEVDLQAVGFGGTDNQITGYVRLGTNGQSAQVQLKRAWISWRGITIGKKTTLFEDNYAASPTTIDPQGPCGIVATTVYEASYVSKSYSGFKFGIGINMPSFYTASGVYLGEDYMKWEGQDIVGKNVCDPMGCSQSIPDVPLFVEWGKTPLNRIRLSGILRNFRYRDILEGKNRYCPGWGVQLSGNLNPIEPLIFYASAVYGAGIGAYIQDLQGVPLSFVPDNDHPGKMKASPMMGLTFGVTYNFSKKWQANAAISRTSLWDVDKYAVHATTNPGAQDNYRYANYVAANVLYNISSYLQVGLEYLWGQRATYGMGKAHDNRLEIGVQFML